MQKSPSPSAVVSPGWLVQRARANSGLSQAELASRVGVAQSVVSRIESDERSGDFASVQQLINHTDYRLVLSLQRAPYERPVWERALTPFKPTAAYLVEECLPEQLVDFNGQFRGGEEHDGPTVGEALYWLGEIAEVWRAASLPERRLQEVYRQTRDERARTLIHTVLHAGEGASHANGLLGALIDELVIAGASQQRRRPTRQRADPLVQDARLGRRGWAHVVISVRAEAWICARNHGVLVEHGEHYMAEEFMEVARQAFMLFEQLREAPGFKAWCEQEAEPEYVAWLLDEKSDRTWRNHRAGQAAERQGDGPNADDRPS